MLLTVFPFMLELEKEVRIMKKQLGKLLCLAAIVLVSMSGCKEESSSTSFSSTQKPSIDSSLSSETISSSSSQSSSSESLSADYGTLSIRDYEVSFMGETIITPAFSKEEYEEELKYSFDGNNISIAGNTIKGLIPNTETTVTAKSEHFEVKFKVKVNYQEFVLQNDSGNETKSVVSLPAETNKYLLHFQVTAENYVDSYTRLSSFAFNDSNNSWYNIEMNETGDLYLYGCFNGIAKNGISVGNKSIYLKDEKISYSVEILVNGLSTCFFLNDRLLCSYSEEEMKGSLALSSLQISSAADRNGGGKYKIDYSKCFYEKEDSKSYLKYSSSSVISYPDITLSREDGNESKFVFGDFSLLYPSFVFSSTIDVTKWDTQSTRLAAYAFNQSDNSWYNIEMDSSGNINLHAHFNGIERYNIFLANKDQLLTDDVIHFEINIMKKGEATWFCFNEKPICSFGEEEMSGYDHLKRFEVTATSDVWHEGTAYSVTYSNMKVENDSSKTYLGLLNKVYRQYDDCVLEATDGSEKACKEIPIASYEMIFTTKVIVSTDALGWFRPSAFAFNNSDNSWYNIETNIDGIMTLYAHFNGVEKYGIALGNKADCTIDGVFSYQIAILKKGQATYFFFNDALKASFSEEEMKGYRFLSSLNITSSANREGKSYSVNITDTKVEDKESANYSKYFALIK